MRFKEYIKDEAEELTAEGIHADEAEELTAAYLRTGEVNYRNITISSMATMVL